MRAKKTTELLKPKPKSWLTPEGLHGSVWLLRQTSDRGLSSEECERILTIAERLVT